MISVFDFFSGCGGTSLGFKNSGFEILGGLDFDTDSSKTFKYNFPSAYFLKKDIRDVNPSELTETLKRRKHKRLLFSGCAPCQPFSGQRTISKENDSRINLLSEFQRFIEYHKPDYIFLENVPGIQHVNRSNGVFSTFLKFLDSNNYKFQTEVVNTYHLGVPQRRKRLVLIAANTHNNIENIEKFLNKENTSNLTVKQAISDLPVIKAGESHIGFHNHIAAKLSEKNLKRIKATPQGGDRRNWPNSLMPNCHKTYTGHTDVYGRMQWDAPAPTLTTKCISYTNGRFGHPEQDRAISVREAARIQTFSDDFVFIGSMNSCARQVGNAVPPKMSEILSKAFC